MDEFKRYVAKQNSFYYNIFMVNIPEGVKILVSMESKSF